MNINRWIAVTSLALSLHTQVQTPTPAPAPAQTTAPATAPQPVSGPTMEQTIAFINDAYITQPDSRYHDNEDHPDAGFYFGHQEVRLSGACELEYKLAYALSRDVDSVANANLSSSTRTLKLNLADPRSITINNDKQLLIDADGTEFKLRGNPAIFQVIVTQGASVEQHTLSSTFNLGFFTDKDLAERVAKAYIHAIVLCHKPKAPSLF